MPYPVILFWKKMPVIRLLIPFFLGIMQQRYWPFTVSVLHGLVLICTGLICLYSSSILPSFRRYRSGFINGLSVFLLFAAMGSLSVWRQDIRNRSLWPGNIYKESDALRIKLLDNPVEKPNTLKATATLVALLRNHQQIPVEGKILVYLNKDASCLQVSAGDELITNAPLLPIPKNANPGTFDFQQYSFQQGITHQVFVRNNFIVTGHHLPALHQLTGNIRQWVLSVLKKAFPDKPDRGLAEALLIGYKDELDKALVQSYTNTGVVHIIAISGLHLGLIYWLLVNLFKPLSRNRRLKWLPPLLIVGGLWLFTLLAGAQPSVLRSAIMFSCIVAGNTLSRRSNIYNSLALSAFLLLAYNPYWLWDAGFQLSYAAITGIVAFMKPIYLLMSFRNKLVDLIWQMNAVTLSAQLLTLPVCIYHFHQFPNYFLLSNFVAVPLSSLILLLEILLCIVSFLPSLFFVIAKLTGLLIHLMNACVRRVEELPFPVWNGLQISFVQAVLLTVFIILMLCCLTHRDKIRSLIYGAVTSLSIFMIFRCLSFIEAGRQQKVIVYQHSADFIRGRDYVSLNTTGMSNDFNTGGTRTLFRLRPAKNNLLIRSGNMISFLSAKILLVNDRLTYFSTNNKPGIDLLILSRDLAAQPAELTQSMNIRQVVADATVPAWKLRKWQQHFDSLRIPFHDVRTKGAFVMSL